MFAEITSKNKGNVANIFTHTTYAHAASFERKHAFVKSTLFFDLKKRLFRQK